jgi:integrase
MAMGRQPTKNLNLPKGMRARPKAKGKIYYYFDTGAKPRKEIPLGSDYVLAVQQWAGLSQHEIPANATITFKMAWDKFLKDYLPNKSAATKKDYLKCGKFLLKCFNDEESPAPLDSIQPIHIRQYLDTRGKKSQVRANHERRLFNLIWNLAREWGYTDKPNPCAGVKGFSEKSRDVYIEDNIYNLVYSYADQPTKDALDLGYLTAQRPADVIKMYKTDIQDGVLYVQQGKTETKLRIAVTGQLKSVIDRINQRKENFKVFSLALIVDEHGKKLSQHAIYKRFLKAKEEAIKENPKLKEKIEEYQIRDLRAKAVTDKTSQGDVRQAQKLAGHASESMTQRYVRNKIGENVEPTK